MGTLKARDESTNKALVTYGTTRLRAQLVENLPAVQEMQLRSLGEENPLEKEMATHSSILGWRIPWTEEPGGVQSMGLQELTQLIEEHFHFKGDTL